MKKSATWIWYPGDFEIWLGNRCNNRRTERGAMFPPFWKQDSHYVTVEFRKTVVLEEDECIIIKTEGQFNFSIDGKLNYPHAEQHIPKGKHTLSVKVWNQATPPALFVEGNTVKTDASWLVTYEDKIWIDENGVAHGCGIYMNAGAWNFNSSDAPPSQFQLPRKELLPVSIESIDDKEKHLYGTLYDFGQEVFGYLKVFNLEGGNIRIYYGESREEALDPENCETLDVLEPSNIQRRTNTSTNTWHYELDSKAFRYVFIEPTPGHTQYDGVAVDYEYAPFDESRSGSFRCSDELLNKIWQVSAYTLDLTTREFFIDGIKRDRWTWSGDAIQSYLMNYYLRFDTECVKRTIRQLRGKDPVTSHVNTIMDYTFYWFKSVLDYYDYTGDMDFVREMYPRMKTLMEYCCGRLNDEGMAEGMPDDWIFVDWVDFPMHKRGVLCFEQILFTKALETMATCATLLRDHPLDNPPQGSITPDEYESDMLAYGVLSRQLLTKWKTAFWSEEKHAYLHAIENGETNPQITKFPNMFAILYGYATPAEQKTIQEHVMDNGNIEKITTPYMRFYELETLCMCGEQKKVLEEMKSYWGGMLHEGVTTFWEKYNPKEHGKEHLTMYGRPYGKSLCHAWGASPLYLLGKYFLGVRPVKPGYEEYEVRPVLGGLEWMSGEVPTPFGKIQISVYDDKVSVYSEGGRGVLVLGDQRYEIKSGERLEVLKSKD